jgi:hypothetical protein
MTETIITSALGLFGLWVVVYYLWPDYRDDSYREDIFSVRDEMFLFACDNNIPFDHPAYTLLRTRMNLLIRHGHGLTVSRLLILSTLRRDVESETFVAWQRAVEELPEALGQQMREFNLRINIFALQHVVYRSFFRYLCFRPVMAVLSLAGVSIRVVMTEPRVERTVENLESVTIDGEDRERELIPA